MAKNRALFVGLVAVIVAVFFAFAVSAGFSAADCGPVSDPAVLAKLNDADNWHCTCNDVPGWQTCRVSPTTCFWSPYYASGTDHNCKYSIYGYPPYNSNPQGATGVCGTTGTGDYCVCTGNYPGDLGCAVTSSTSCAWQSTVPAAGSQYSSQYSHLCGTRNGAAVPYSVPTSCPAGCNTSVPSHLTNNKKCLCIVSGTAENCMWSASTPASDQRDRTPLCIDPQASTVTGVGYVPTGVFCPSRTCAGCECCVNAQCMGGPACTQFAESHCAVPPYGQGRYCTSGTTCAGGTTAAGGAGQSCRPQGSAGGQCNAGYTCVGTLCIATAQVPSNAIQCTLAGRKCLAGTVTSYPGYMNAGTCVYSATTAGAPILGNCWRVAGSVSCLDAGGECDGSCPAGTAHYPSHEGATTSCPSGTCCKVSSSIANPDGQCPCSSYELGKQCICFKCMSRQTWGNNRWGCRWANDVSAYWDYASDHWSAGTVCHDEVSGGFVTTACGTSLSWEARPECAIQTIPNTCIGATPNTANCPASAGSPLTPTQARCFSTSCQTGWALANSPSGGIPYNQHFTGWSTVNCVSGGPAPNRNWSCCVPNSALDRAGANTCETSPSAGATRKCVPSGGCTASGWQVETAGDASTRSCDTAQICCKSPCGVKNGVCQVNTISTAPDASHGMRNNTVACPISNYICWLPGTAAATCTSAANQECITKSSPDNTRFCGATIGDYQGWAIVTGGTNSCSSTTQDCCASPCKNGGGKTRVCAASNPGGYTEATATALGVTKACPGTMRCWEQSHGAAGTGHCATYSSGSKTVEGYCIAGTSCPVGGTGMADYEPTHPDSSECRRNGGRCCKVRVAACPGICSTSCATSSVVAEDASQGPTCDQNFPGTGARCCNAPAAGSYTCLTNSPAGRCAASAPAGYSVQRSDLTCPEGQGGCWLPDGSPTAPGGGSGPTTGNCLKDACGGAAIVKGMDISYWQSTIDWQAVAGSDIKFAFIRASVSTVGTMRADTEFARNWAEAKRNGILRGAYHFFRADKNAADQANLFVSQLGSDYGELPPVIDVEIDEISPYSADRDTWIRGIATWMSIVEQQTGKKPMIYTSPGMWSAINTDRFKDYPLWIANWEVNCPRIPSAWDAWLFWQSCGMCEGAPGVRGKVDIDAFNGNLDQLRALSQGGSYSPPTMPGPSGGCGTPSPPGPAPPVTTTTAPAGSDAPVTLNMTLLSCTNVASGCNVQFDASSTKGYTYIGLEVTKPDNSKIDEKDKGEVRPKVGENYYWRWAAPALPDMRISAPGKYVLTFFKEHTISVSSAECTVTAPNTVTCSGAGSNKCPSENGFERRCVTQSEAQTLQGQGWAEDDLLLCTNDDSCCTTDKPICMVKLSNQTNSCKSEGVTIRRCAASGQSPGAEWRADTSLSCSNSNTCCPDKGLCWAKRLGILVGAGAEIYRHATLQNRALVNFTGLVSNYTGTISAFKFVVNGTEMGSTKVSDVPTPVRNATFVSGPKEYARATTFTYYGKAVTEDGNFTTQNYTLAIPNLTIKAVNLTVGATFASLGGGAYNITLTAARNDTPAAGEVVRFYLDSTLKGDDFSMPYSLTVGPFQGGTTHSYQAKLVTADGNFTSALLTIALPVAPKAVVTVNATVLLVAGTNSSNLNLTAEVANYTGSVVKVHIFVDNASRIQSTSRPYTGIVDAFTTGTMHTYYATAITSDGNMSSRVYNVTIPSALPGETFPVVSCPTNCSVYLYCGCGVSNCQVGEVYIASEASGSLFSKKVTTGQFTFVPLSAGQYNLQAICGTKQSSAYPVNILETELRVNLTSFSCGTPDRHTCTVTVDSKNKVPLDLFILGTSPASRASAHSSVKRSTIGWTGLRELVFSDITYDGSESEQYDLTLYVYPKDVYLDLPAAFVYLFPLGRV